MYFLAKHTIIYARSILLPSTATTTEQLEFKMSQTGASGDTIELADIHEDTAIFGDLVEDLMRRTSSRNQQGNASFNTNIEPLPMIRHLTMDGFGALREPPWKESRNVDLFFHALVLCPLKSICLENIGCFPYDTRSGTFPIQLVTRLLQTTGTAPSCLQSLELRDIIFEGLMLQDWEAFAEALGTLQHLEIFVLETCDCTIEFPSEQFTDFNLILQKLLSGPIKSQTLRALTLVPAQNYGGGVESTVVQAILQQSSSLRELKISNIGRLSDEVMTTIFTSLTQQSATNEETDLSKTTNLELLHLNNCDIGASALDSLLKFLGSQQQNLKTVHIGLASTPNRKASHFIYREAPMIDLFGALKLNRTLKKFILTSDGTPNKLTPVASNAYQEMMQLNCYLLDMFVTYPTLHFHPHVMNFYAKLNSLNRRQFLQESHLVTRRKWVDMLGEVADDESCLFYFLRLNPLLCKCP